MANSADKRFECDNTPTIGTGLSITIAETSTIDSEVRSSKGKTVWEKSPDDVEDEVEALIQSREDSCPERKRQLDKFNKEWDEDEEFLDWKHTFSTPSVGQEIMATRQKIKEAIAELKELQSQIEEAIEKIIRESKERLALVSIR